MPLEELESQCALELKKLQELAPDVNLDSLGTEDDDPAEENTTSRGVWIAMIPEVIKVVQEVLEEGKTCCPFYAKLLYFYQAMLKPPASFGMPPT